MEFNNYIHGRWVDSQTQRRFETLNPATGELSDPRQAAVTPAPSFLCRGPRDDVVYSVSETAEGGVSAWRLSDSAAVPLGTCSTAGADPCHVHALSAIDSLVVTNYTGGSLAVVPVAGVGAPGSGP